MEIELKIEGNDTSDSEDVFISLSINGDSNMERARLRWHDCGKILRRLGSSIFTRSIEPDDWAGLLAKLILYIAQSNEQYEQENDRQQAIPQTFSKNDEVTNLSAKAGRTVGSPFHRVSGLAGQSGLPVALYPARREVWAMCVV